MARAVAVALAGILSTAGCASSGAPASAAVVRAEVTGSTGNTGSPGSTRPVKAADDVVPVTAFVTVTHHDHYPPETGTITDPSTIAQLAKLINALPTAPADTLAIPCASAEAPAYQLDFRAAKDSPPAAVVSIECFGVMVTAHGHDEPLLDDSVPPGRTSFLNAVGALVDASAVGSPTATR